jgi:hypothetical protein
MKTLTKIVMFLSLVAVIFNGCGSSGGSSTPANNKPVATQSLVTKSVTEDSSLSYDLTSNVTDSDSADTLSVLSLVMADGSALASGITLVGNEIKVADTISVADGQNLTYDLNASVTDSKDSVTYQVRVVIQDRSNDSLMTHTINIANSIDDNATLSGSIELVDSDGLSNTNISFELLDRNDSNNSVYTGTMTDVGNDGNYTFSIDLQAQSIDASHYTFKTSAISPVIGGENPQSDVTITHNFQVVSTPTISFANTSVDDDGGGFTNSVGTPTTDGVVVGATYEIVSESPSTSNMLSINTTSGEMEWLGDVAGPTNYDITIKVTNPDGGTDSHTFTLTVNNNG